MVEKEELSGSEMMGCVSFSHEECFGVRVWLCHSRNASPAGSCLLMLCLCGLHCLFLPNLVNAVYLKSVRSLQSPIIYNLPHLEDFFLQSQMFRCVPSRQSIRETTMIYYTDFLYCSRQFIAAKTTEMIILYQLICQLFSWLINWLFIWSIKH